ncbi:hypothetical protein SAMN06309944_1714 [Micrococcales bacterium KH10]|nr:hypothetical protein SAMN06309944_1714 [Micrococcales bacterium KH10]
MIFASTSSRSGGNRLRQLPALLAALLVACLTLSGVMLAAVPAAKADESPWVATWGRAAGGLTNSGDCNPCSVRNTLHLTIGGSKIRLKVSNGEPGSARGWRIGRGEHRSTCKYDCTAAFCTSTGRWDIRRFGDLEEQPGHDQPQRWTS